MNPNLSTQPVPFYRQPAWLLGFLAFVTFVVLVAGRVTPFLSFARVPLLSLALFAAIVPTLATRNLKSLLIGAYDLSGLRDGMILGLLLVLCGMTIYTTATLCMEVGPARFESRGIVHLSLWAKSVLGLLVWCGISREHVLCRQLPEWSDSSADLTRCQACCLWFQPQRGGERIGLRRPASSIGAILGS